MKRSPLKKSPPKSSFDRSTLEAIWGSYPACIVTNNIGNVDAHHILGRSCPSASSPYNCAILHRPFHQGPHRDKPDIRSFLLKETRIKVNAAIRDGRYVATETDAEFLEYAESYLLYPVHQ